MKAHLTALFEAADTFLKPELFKGKRSLAFEDVTEVVNRVPDAINGNPQACAVMKHIITMRENLLCEWFENIYRLNIAAKDSSRTKLCYWLKRHVTGEVWSNYPNPNVALDIIAKDEKTGKIAVERDVWDIIAGWKDLDRFTDNDGTMAWDYTNAKWERVDA